MKKDCDGIKEHIERVVKPIFDGVPKEQPSNSMTTTKKTFKILWRPHNYRRQIKVKTRANSTQEIKVLLGRFPVEYSIHSHTKLIFIRGFRSNITLQYGKETLTVIHSQNIIGGHKETFLIEANSINDIARRVTEKKEGIKQKMDEALFEFIKKAKIKLRFEKPKWSRYEDWLKGEDYIDKIPREVIIHDTYFKKVYSEGLEFIGPSKGEDPGVHMKNYIKNRALEDVAPEIHQDLNKMMHLLESRVPKNVNDISNVISNDINKRLDELFKFPDRFNRLSDSIKNKALGLT